MIKKNILSDSIYRELTTNYTLEKLSENHIIKILYNEHVEILLKIKKIKQIAVQLIDPKIDNKNDLLKKLNYLIVKVISAEPHHQREERILFPFLKSLKIETPIQSLTMEHEIMRKISNDLNFIIVKNYFSPKKLYYISELSNRLCILFENHIKKENVILFPLAINKIKDKETLKRLKDESDDLGYCCFCPTN